MSSFLVAEFSLTLVVVAVADVEAPTTTTISMISAQTTISNYGSLTVEEVNDDRHNELRYSDLRL